MTLREALKVAMDAEVKAWEFFDAALKLPLSPPVKKLFEELRAEEIVHQNMVRSELAKAPAGLRRWLPRTSPTSPWRSSARPPSGREPGAR